MSICAIRHAVATSTHSSFCEATQKTTCKRGGVFVPADTCCVYRDSWRSFSPEAAVVGGLSFCCARVRLARLHDVTRLRGPSLPALCPHLVMTQPCGRILIGVGGSGAAETGELGGGDCCKWSNGRRLQSSLSITTLIRAAVGQRSDQEKRWKSCAMAATPFGVSAR